MGYSDEATQLRRRQAAFVDRLASYPGQVVDGSPSLVIQITSATSGSIPRYCAATIATPLGSEVVGSVATFDADTVTFLVACVNGGTPSVGARFVATLIDGYWCFEG